MPAMFGQDWRSVMSQPQQMTQSAQMPSRNAQGGWQMPMPSRLPPPTPQAAPAPQTPAPMMGVPQQGSWAQANGWWTPRGMMYPVVPDFGGYR